MKRFFSWIMAHKVSFFLLLVIVYLLFKNAFSGYQPRPLVMEYGTSGMMNAVGAPSFTAGTMMGSTKQGSMMDTYEASTGQDARMVVQSSTLSILVKNVTETKDVILAKTQEMGGFMVNTSITNPQDAASATISVRIPAKEFEKALKTFRDLSLKVIAENIEGEDITDQYTDTQARMETLTKTKAKFEEILDKATEVQDILNVQREIINLQAQIDALKGQQQFLEKNAEMAHLTIFLSTDELALPYSPELSWRPELIFKQAVRSMIGAFRQVGTVLIWVAVYSVIWIPLLVLFLFFKKRMRNPQTNTKTN